MTITLCLVPDHKTVVRKFGKSDGQTGSQGLHKAVLAQGAGGGGTRPWWLALLACGGGGG